MAKEGLSTTIYSAMQTGKPFKSYKKTILGRLYLNIIDPFSGDKDGIILYGNPRNKADDETCVIDVWSEMEDQFLRRMNKRHFESGQITEYKRPEQESVQKEYVDYSDEELTSLLNQRFAALNSTLIKIKESAVVYRLLTLAQENDKSAKIIDLIKSRLSDLQAQEYGVEDDASNESG